MAGVDIATIDIIPGTGGILDSDLWGNIVYQLHQNSPAIAYELKEMVRALTPVLSGSLLSDINFEIGDEPDVQNSGTGGGEIDLFFVYTEQVAQEAYWHRIYAVFQEGGILGEPTYTNDPHEMFYLTASGDGLAAVEAWAIAVVGIANGISSVGSGVNFIQPPNPMGNVPIP